MHYNRIVLQTVIVLVGIMNLGSQCTELMKPNQVLDLSQNIQNDLERNVEEKVSSVNIIHGTGFSYLNTQSDMLSVQEILLAQLQNFIQAYLQTIELGSHEANQALRKFCSTLKHAKMSKWKKFEFLYANEAGQGSWIGIFFRKKDQHSAEFYSNHIKVAFSLMPDVFIIREEESSSFLGFKQTDSRYYIVERNRGFTREDLASILTVCSAFTHNKAIGP